MVNYPILVEDVVTGYTYCVHDLYEIAVGDEIRILASGWKKQTDSIGEALEKQRAKESFWRKRLQSLQYPETPVHIYDKERKIKEAKSFLKQYEYYGD